MSVHTAALQVLRGVVVSVLLGTTTTTPAHAQAPPVVGPEPDAAGESSGTPADSTAQLASSRDSTVDTARVAAGAAGPRVAALTTGINSAVDWSSASASDTAVKRTKAVEYSEGYYKRLAIHRVTSYAVLPLFVTEYILGQKLINDEINGDRGSSDLRNAHTVVAASIGVLFAANTVTGLWNLLEARHDPNGRTRRTIHGISMLVADAGFLYTASIAGDAKHSVDAADRHRNAALASISLATASALMMWLWKD